MGTKPYSEYTLDELFAAQAGNDPYKAPPASGIVRRAVGDTTTALASGLAGLGKAAYGIADIATIGGVSAADRALQRSTGASIQKSLGRLQEDIGKYYSPEAKAALGAVQKAEGAGGTLRAVLDNPSTVPLYLAESAAPMGAVIGTAGKVAKSAIARGMTQAQAVARAGKAATAAEGVLSAGSVAEDVRSQGGDTASVLASAIPAGVAVSVLGKAAGKATGGPLEAILARRAAGKAMPTAGVLGGAALGAVVEGSEEAAQSASEQLFTNFGTGQDLLKDVGKSATLGALTGAPLGGVLGGLSPQTLSVDAVDKKPVDPLGDQREAFTTELNVLKQKYVDDVASGMPEPDARSLYQVAAQGIKEKLIASAAVPEEVGADPTVGEALPVAEKPIASPAAEDMALLDTEDDQDIAYPSAAPIIESLGDTPNGASLAQAIQEAAADPEAQLALRNAIQITLTKEGADPETLAAVTAVLDAPETAADNVDLLDPVVEAMQATISKFYDNVSESLLAFHPELAAEINGDAIDTSTPSVDETANGVQIAPVQPTYPDEMQGKTAKGRAMRAAAATRQATGQLTAKEQAAVAKREASNYKGKQVIVGGQPATVVSTPYGKVRVMFADGSTKSVASDQVTPAKSSAQRALEKVNNEPKGAFKKAPKKPAANPMADKAAKVAGETLDVQSLLAVPKTVRASLGKKLSEAVGRALTGQPTTVVRDSTGAISKHGTTFVKHVSDAANSIADLSRRVDLISAKVAPRVTESRANIDGLKEKANALLADLSSAKKRPTKAENAALLTRYTELRKSMSQARGGKLGDPDAEAFRARFTELRDGMPKKADTPSVAQMRAAVQELTTFLNGNPNTGRYITAMVFEDADNNLAELNDKLSREIKTLLQLLGAKKGDKASHAIAQANLDKIVAAYKSAKFAVNKAEQDEFGAFETDEDGDPVDTGAYKERNRFDRRFSMAWSAYKQGRIARLANRATGLTTGPLSNVSDNVIRLATETGVGADASQSPLAVAYREGYVYDKNRPDNRTPPGTRAVLSYIMQTNTGMGRTLAGLLKESLAVRMPRKGMLVPKNPINMLFLTPEQAAKFGVVSARWYNAAALKALCATDPSLPATGELIMVNRASPEAILHELLHAATANWVKGNAKDDTVMKLHAQLDIAIAEATKQAKAGVPEGSPLAGAVATLESIKAAGDVKGLSKDQARANRVAEFISYAMTRAPFQEFLSKIVADKAQTETIAYTASEKTLISKLGNLFNAFVDVLRKLLGIKAATATTPARFERNREFMTYLVNRVILVNKLAAESGAKARTAAATMDVVELDAATLDHTTAANMTAEQAMQARKSLPPRKMNIFDRMMSYPFRVLGAKWYANDGAGIKALEAQSSAKFDEFMKAHPMIASVVGSFVEYVGVSKPVVQQFKQYMQERGKANQLGNIIEDALHAMPKDQQNEFMSALLEPKERGKLPIDQQELVKTVEAAIKSLQARATATGGLDKSLTNASISELIQYAVNKEQLATKGFNASVIKLSGQKMTAVTDAKDVVWQHASAYDPASAYTVRYYPVYAKADPTKIDYFIADTEVADLAASGADTTASWSFSKTNKAGKATFVRNKSFAQIRAEYPAVPVANYLANTLAVMSKVVAARQLVDSIYDINDGAEAKDKIVFDSAEDIEAALGRKPVSYEWKNDGKELSPAQKVDARRPDRWVQLVGKKYGDLNGKYVNGSIFGALQDMHSDSQFINSPKYNAVLRFWKGAKTKLSPGTHVTNVLSSVTMMYMHDIPLGNVKIAASIMSKALGSKLGKPKVMTATERAIYNKFIDSGALLGNYSANELHRKATEAITESMLDGTEEPGSIWETTKQMLGYETEKAKAISKALDAAERGGTKVGSAAKRIDDILGGLYETEDNVFRMAAFMTEYQRLQEQGELTEKQLVDQAGAFARYAMIDYEITAKGINALRQTALPFLAWTYRAAPMLVRTAYTKPWKIANLMTAAYAINALAYASIEGEDEEEERRMLDPYMRQKIWGFGPSAYIRMPWGDKDNPVFWGAGKYLPGGDLIGTSENGAFGVPAWPTALTPSGPAVSFLAAAFGYDNFQGRTLWEPTNSWTQNAGASLEYLVRQMSPVSPDKAVSAILDDKKGLVGNDINHMYAITRYFGSRMYQVNAAEQQYKRGKDMERAVQDYKAYIRKMARAEARLGNPDWDALQEETTAATERLHSKIQDLRGEE